MKRTNFSHFIGSVFTLLSVAVGQSHACSVDTPILQEVSLSGVTHMKGMYGMENTMFATFYRETDLKRGVYEVYNPNEDDGLIEIGDGIWITKGYGCYSLYGRQILVWNGYSGEICDENEYDHRMRECR